MFREDWGKRHSIDTIILRAQLTTMTSESKTTKAVAFSVKYITDVDDDNDGFLGVPDTLSISQTKRHSVTDKNGTEK